MPNLDAALSLDVCHAGGGKGACDEAIAHIKWRLRVHVDAAKHTENDITTPQEWYAGIEKHNTPGGIVSHISVKKVHALHNVTAALTNVLPKKQTNADRIYVVRNLRNGDLECNEALRVGVGVIVKRAKINSALYKGTSPMAESPYRVLKRGTLFEKPRVSLGGVSRSDDLREEIKARKARAERARSKEEQARAKRFDRAEGAVFYCAPPPATPRPARC